MKIRYEMQRGWPNQISLHQRVSAYARTDRCLSFKIGITNNPVKRASDYRNHGTAYDEMIVLYETSSLNHVRNMETILCERFLGMSDNINAGGGGRTGQGPFYLYLVAQHV